MKLSLAPTLLLTLLAFLASLGVAAAARATVPGQVSYQGLLLDDMGAPVTATVAMEFELFDAPSAGSSLWFESHPAVQVVDGVYDVVLGAITPIDQNVVQGGSIHLEVTVEGETLTPRQQLLMVPYALRAEVAEQATSLGDYEAAYFDAIIEYQSFDGQAPGNTHPDEGTIDVDGDGRPNFIDVDNDGDGYDDGDEVSQGSDINLVTPRIDSFTPSTADGFETTLVQVFGANFEPGMAVQFGTESPTPGNVNPTYFQVSVGPQPEGTAQVTVTRTNGESTTADFDFFLLSPVISSMTPDEFDEGIGGTLTVTGSNFHPGMTVQFGSQFPTPSSVTPNSFEITVTPEPPGNPALTVTLPNGNSDVDSSFVVHTGAPRTIFISSLLHSGDFGGLAGADAFCQGLASTAGVEGTYFAWLADGTSSPSTRNSQKGPYLMTDSTKVADDWADLTDGDVDAPISVNQSGSTVTGGVSVWTNVAAVGAGAAGSDHCSSWTSASSGDFGERGNRSQIDARWTEIGTTIACDVSAYLYCVEQ